MATFKQDMPPPGGYAPINFQRVPIKKIINGWWLLGFSIVGSVLTGHRYLRWKYYNRKLQIEKFDTLIALQPFIEAERDRKYLRQLRVNYWEEKELMKDHYGWETGTLYGDPLYLTINKTDLPDVPLHDFYAHAYWMDHLQNVWPDYFTS